MAKVVQDTIRVLEQAADLEDAVYKVSEYARDHPGGPEALMEVAGTDATSAYEDVGHSEDAREIMHPMIVGSLKGASADDAGSKSSSPDASTVKIVRRSPGRQEHAGGDGKGSASLVHWLELAAFALGTTGAVWAAGHAGLWQNLPHLAAHGGFAQGFLLAGVTSTVIAAGSVRYLSSVTKLGRDPFELEAHRHASHVVASSHHPSGAIAAGEYRKFKLSSKTELSKGIWRFIFALPTSSSVLGLPTGQHIGIRGEVDDHTVTRSYTPISNNRDLGRLELLIRIYPDGKMGKHLSQLQVGGEAEIRGPKGAMRYRKGMSKRIGMIGGGTGITPLFQIIRAICEDKTDNTEVSLVYGNRSEADIMLRQQLDRYSKESQGQFRIRYVLDRPSENWTGHKGYIDKDLLGKTMPKPATDSKILLCGPPGMVNAVEESLISLGFEKPGAVAKMSDQIFLF